MSCHELAPLVARSALSALICAACSPSATCDAQQSAYDSPAIESDARSGTLHLGEANENQSLHFRATLSDLPELRSGDGLVAGGLPLELSLRYEHEPFGGDGRTEMPRLSVSFIGRDPIEATSTPTSRYPGPQPFTFSPSLFEDCAIGARECETALTINVERLDGAPYPPVTVSWLAAVSARVPTCSVLTRDTRAALEIEVEGKAP